MWGDQDETVEDEVVQRGGGGEHEDLHVILECDRAHAGSVRFCLTAIEEVVIGRGAQRTATRSEVAGRTRLTVSVPDSHMSSAHAKLTRSETGWVLTDTESRNGTFLDGRKTTRAKLQYGALLELGHTFFFLRECDLSQATDPAAGAAAMPDDLPGLSLDHGRQASLGRLWAVARGGLPILLTGEPGVGKKRLALALHRRLRPDAQFVVFDCCLAERDGGKHGAAGSFVTAFARSLEKAAGGTLLLSDVGALSSDAQGALLRLLSSTSTSQRVALMTTVPTEPGAHAEPASLRPSLLAYLGAFALFVPPLRERKEELGALLAEVLNGSTDAASRRYQIDPPLAYSLLQHDWPCNVRELENCIRSAIALSSDGVLRLGTPDRSMTPPPVPSASGEMPIVRLPASTSTPEPDPEFAQNVRRALRCNLSIAGLQRNGLLYSYMVQRKTKGPSVPAATVPALRQLILESIEALRGSPRGEKQCRVLHLTFITPTATQHEAADRLAMAFGTYRRYVTAAIAELTTNLWFAELSARFELEQPSKRAGWSGH
jgi:sigma-54 dependent transcriptional regulator, acetoin dehydrogenase operon transcriptional activator AcoR